MDHLVYLAASGARETMLAQAVNTHNLANAATAGFRADLIAASSAPVAPGPMNTRIYAGVHGSGVDFSDGAVNATGRELDIAVNGAGWIAVQAADGSPALTRRGDLRVSELGQLVNGAGLGILGEAGPIALPPYSQISIGADGTVSIVPLGEDPDTLSVVDRIRLVNPDPQQIRKGQDGLLRVPGDAAPPADDAVTLIPASLEASNVDTVGAMVQMIELSRQFEVHVRMMRTAEQLDHASTELMNIN